MLIDSEFHRDLIETAYSQISSLSPDNASSTLTTAVAQIIQYLNTGMLRVAEKKQGVWIVHEWIKKAILLYFRLHDNTLIDAGYTQYFDKIPLKYTPDHPLDITQPVARIVPSAVIRYGAYIAPKTVLMPSFVNIGAYVDEGSMIDTWATVGSCVQIGKNVHLSGGVGIGGVLEPLQSQPTIIEDNCFIGARSEIVEGVIVEQGAVIGMGVFIGASTRIYHREKKTITYGRIPAGSVVVSGSLPSQDGTHHLYCAVIVKEVDEKTRAKTSINALLRSD